MKKIITIILILAALVIAQETVKIDGLQGEWLLGGGDKILSGIDLGTLEYHVQEWMALAAATARGNIYITENNLLGYDKYVISDLIDRVEKSKYMLLRNMIEILSKNNFVREKDVVDILNTSIKKYNNNSNTQIAITQKDKEYIRKLIVSVKETNKYIDELSTTE